MSHRYVSLGPGRWQETQRAELGRNLGVAVAAQEAAAEDPVAVAAQAAAAEDLGAERTDDASDHGVGSVRSVVTTQFGDRSEAGTVGGQSAEEDDGICAVRICGAADGSSIPYVFAA